jgi:plastocyanin
MQSKRVQLRVLTCAVLFVMAAAACGGGERPAGETAAGGAAATPARGSAPTDTADGPGVITGSALFQGTAPRPRPLSTDSDPLCKPEPGATAEGLLVGPDKGLQNAFVYVKDGLGARTYAVPTTTVTLDQKGCRYIPHVIGVQVGQTVLITNSDAALHNVNATPKNNRAFNFGQPVGVPPAKRLFDKPEIGVPFRCDVHPWMNAYAGVVAHPFFAVTGADGRFEIKGLPAGTYTLEAWHEQLGTQTQTVTVDGTTPAKASFEFKAQT